MMNVSSDEDFRLSGDDQKTLWEERSFAFNARRRFATNCDLSKFYLDVLEMQNCAREEAEEARKILAGEDSDIDLDDDDEDTFVEEDEEDIAIVEISDTSDNDDDEENNRSPSRQPSSSSSSKKASKKKKAESEEPSSSSKKPSQEKKAKKSLFILP